MPTLSQLRRAASLVLYGSASFALFQLLGLVTSALVSAKLAPPSLDTVGFLLALVGVLGGWCLFLGWRTLLAPDVARTFLDSAESLRRSLFLSALATAVLWTLFVCSKLAIALQASSGVQPSWGGWANLLRLAAQIALWIFLISAANHLANVNAGFFHSPIRTRARFLGKAINIAFMFFVASIAAALIRATQPWRPAIQLVGAAAALGAMCFYLASVVSLRSLIFSMQDDDEDDAPGADEPPNPYRV